LLVDSQGGPLEFVYNSLAAPAGFLWPEAQVRRQGVPALVRTLFSGCRRDPDLLIASPDLGDPEFCRREMSPTIPFALAEPATDQAPAQWTWLNAPPTPPMRAYSLAHTLQRRGLASEPLERVRAGLREVFPYAAWGEP
ncbi:MAG: hypothetical protein KIS61_16090, partial [Candidatus Eremiobacteraeota bacterium]|nr:hypothetical protein [Candidatus Eremiobacteraeota bacterium]